MDFKNLQFSTENVEINKMAQPKASKAVEIFTDLVKGKDVSKHGKQVDIVVNTIDEMVDAAEKGDMKAKVELHNIRTMLVTAPMLRRLNLFSFMGNVTNVGENEELRIRVPILQGKMSGAQANSGSFAFPTQTWRTKTLETKTVTGGTVTDVREMRSNSYDHLATAAEQVQTDMMNQMFNDIMVDLYNAVKNANIKNFAEADGITESSVKEALKKARRFGETTIMGDYTVLSQLEDMTGFETTTNTKQFSEAVMEEVRRTGLLRSYRGSAVLEIPNGYNFTKLDDDFYQTYLPEGLMFFNPTGQASPLQIGIRSGIRSAQAYDINLNANITRYDLEYGSTVIEENVPAMGLVSDNNYDVDKR